MSAFVQCSLTFAVGIVAAVLSAHSFAQAEASAEISDEVTVRGRRTVTQYRLELEKARDEVFRLYNEANEGNDNDITCHDEQPTGRRIPQNVCRSYAENRVDAATARNFLKRSAGEPLNPPGTQLAANAGTGAAQGAGQAGAAGALAEFEQEWERILRENRQLYRAVVKFAEAEDADNRARGAAVEAEPIVAVVLEEPPAPAQAVGPQCEASV
jgi:hypothetical protein